MPLAFENVQAGTANFGTFGGPGSIGSGVNGTASLSTSGDDKLAVFCFWTGRSLDPPNMAVEAGVETLSIAGHTPVKVLEHRFTNNVAGDDGSYPYGSMSFDVFIVPVPSQVTSLAWSTTTADTYINNQRVVFFSIDAFADINAVDVATFITDNASATNVAPEVQDVDFSANAAVIALFMYHNAGYSPTAESGYTQSSDTAGGHGTSNYKFTINYAVEGSSGSKDIGDSGGSTNYWSGVAVVLSDDVASTTNARLTSAALEVLTTEDGAARVSSVAAEALVSEAGAARITLAGIEVLRSMRDEVIPPLDGGALLEAHFRAQEPAQYGEADWDSIYSIGDRSQSGVMNFGESDTPISPGATFGSSHDGNYAFPFGSGLAINDDLTQGVSYVWLNFDGRDVALAGFRFRGTDEFQWSDPQSWALYGGMAPGQRDAEPYPNEFDEFNPAQNTADPFTSWSTEWPATPRRPISWPHYEFVYKGPSGEPSPTQRFANEIEYKVFHSILDGGDRRATNGRPAKRVTVALGPTWNYRNEPASPDPADLDDDGYYHPNEAMIDGRNFTVAAPVQQSRHVSQIGDVSGYGTPQATVGSWISFAFPRGVIPNKLVIQTNTKEEYDAGAPTLYGKWHWESSNNAGASWVIASSQFQFGEGANYMPAPAAGLFDTPERTEANCRTHWRMVLDEGPAFGGSILLHQFMFDLYDPGGLAVSYSIAFTDDVDGVLAKATIGDAGSPYTVKFSDGDLDVLSFAVTNIPNIEIGIAFSDGESDALEAFSDLFPSIVVQSFAIATGRK